MQRPVPSQSSRSTGSRERVAVTTTVASRIADWASGRSPCRVAATSIVTGRHAATASASGPVPTMPTFCGPAVARWPAAIAAAAAAARRVSQFASITATAVPAAPNTVSSAPSAPRAEPEASTAVRSPWRVTWARACVPSTSAIDGGSSAGRSQRVANPLHRGARRDGRSDVALGRMKHGYVVPAPATSIV